MEDKVLKAFTQLVLKGYTLRKIREEMKLKGFDLPEEDAPLVCLMREILNHKEET